MKSVSFLTFLLATFAHNSMAIEWKNPPVMCPEEILPKGIPCPDFSKVEDVYNDFPANFDSNDMKEWKNNKAADLRLCRNKEVLRRESLKKGTYSNGIVENAWMIVNGGENANLKLEAIQSASLKYEIPPQVLMGAMKQESLLSTLGISPDGGNFSCGMSQLNIQEWCMAMNKLTTAEKVALNWPTSIDCSESVLPTDIVKPLYEIAVKKLGNRASYELVAKDFEGITISQVIKDFPKANNDLQTKRFEAITSFINHCQDINLSVHFKASTLRSLYLNFVPKELREQNQYQNGETFTRTCSTPYALKSYPLHTGWLLAVAMYNAGPRQKDIVDHYFQVKKNQYPTLSPLDLIEALHWGGKAKKHSDLIEFKNQDGDKLTQKWFKSCIVQRHVARVIQHATLPSESIAKSLEQGGCKPDSNVPDYRAVTSGIKQ